VGQVIEKALLRAIAVLMAVTLAAQVMLTDPDLRPLLNFAHRAEGVRIDPSAVAIVTTGPSRSTSETTGALSGFITLAISPSSGAASVWVEVGGVHRGSLSEDGLAQSLTVAIHNGEEIELRAVGGDGRAAVEVVETSPGVVEPARGRLLAVSTKSRRIWARIAPP
jgi:hypothetical protein